jgi:hypothetical protein
MNLKATKGSPKPSYPTFDDYWTQRRKHIGAMALSAGLALGSSMLSGCSQPPPGRLMGQLVEPLPPAGVQPQPPPDTNSTPKLGGAPLPPRLQGEEPQPPPPPPPRLKGKIVAPKAPGTPPPTSPARPTE